MNLPSKSDTVYFPGCSISLLRPDLAKATIGLLRECGLNPAYLHDDDICCGSIARKLGNEKLFQEQISRLIRSTQRAEAKTVITSCPGCMISLIMGRDALGIRNLEICHVSQVLSGLPETDVAGKEKAVVKVAYHDPCELGRGLGIFDPPRSIIDSIGGVKRIELERSRRDSACCGAGSGLRTGFPELATAIARKRLLMAKDAGANILMTSCPWCVENLQSACQGMDIEVADLVAFLAKYKSSR